MSFLTKIDNVVDQNLGFLKNQYVSAVLAIVLIMYASVAAPQLPAAVSNLFEHTLFKVIIFFLIALLFKHDPSVALVAAVIVVALMIASGAHKFKAEAMADINAGEINGTVYNDKKYLSCTCGCDGKAPGCNCMKEDSKFMRTEGDGPVYNETTAIENGVTGYDESMMLANIDDAMAADEMTKDIPTFDGTIDGVSMLNSEVAYRKQDTDVTGYDDVPAFASV